MTHAHDLSDRRWRALFDADAAGEPLTPAERAHLREHRAADPAVRREQAFYRGLAARAAALDPPADPDDPLIAASLRDFFAGAPTNLSPETALQGPAAAPSDLPQETSSHRPARAANHLAQETSPRPTGPAPDDLSARPSARPGLLAGAGLLLAAGLAAVWLLRPAPPSPGEAAPLATRDDTAAPPAPREHAAPPAPREHAAPAAPDPALAPPARAPTLALRDGPLRAGDVDLSPGTAIPPAAPLRAGATAACLEGPDRSTLCLEPGSGARLLPDGALELTGGVARVAATGPTAIAVVVAGVRATTVDADLRLEVRSDAWTAEVARGAVSLADADGPLARLGPGDRLHRAAASPTPADVAIPADPGMARTTRPTRAARPAGELLDEARALRAAGEHAKAARAYEALIAAHPDAPAATAALVTLGQLYLGRLADPAAALRTFDRYLQRAPDGALAEEAAVGRIDALRRLGRAAEERAAITRFLDRHPTSSYADALRRRLSP